jgi:hypothetical protein
MLRQVEYDPCKQEKLIVELLERVELATKEAVASAKESLRGMLMQNSGRFFGIFIHLLASWLKDKCFSEEKEWRLLSYQLPGEPPNANYRASDHRIVPYLTVDIDEPLKKAEEVVLGWSSPIPEADHGLRMLVRHSTPLAKISKSQVPVR